MLLKQAQKKKSEINIIPMVDIVFQLIIFFLVAMQVKENKVTKLRLPRARNAKKAEGEEETALIINILSPKVDKRRPYRVARQAFDLPKLRLLLSRMRALADKTTEEMPVVRVRADMNSEFEAIQKALIACRDAKVWQIRLTTKKPAN